jgi:hypothetical protein
VKAQTNQQHNSAAAIGLMSQWQLLPQAMARLDYNATTGLNNYLIQWSQASFAEKKEKTYHAADLPGAATDDNGL